MALASLIQSVQTAFGASADQVGREDIEIPNAVPSTDQKVKNIKSTTKPPPTGKVSPTSTLDGTRKSARRTSDVSHHSSDATDSEEETNAIANTNGNASAAANTRFCVHLTPTRQEFSRPFAEYMTAFFKKNPDCPCVRVTPPAGYKPRRKQLQEKDMESLQINAPIKQHVFGRSGAYMAVLEEQKAMTAAQYKAIATKKDRQPPTRGQSGVREERDREMERGQGRQRQEQQQDLMERSFWSGVTLNPPIYGADTVMDLSTGKVEITSQNHGFAVDEATLPPDLEVTHRNLNDGTIEGLRHRTVAAASVQYHPEAAAGPHDSAYLFGRFRDMMA